MCISLDYHTQVFMINHVAIIGLGLMGGSLGLALRRNPGMRVSGYARREETRHLALECGAVDDVFDDPAKAVRGAQLTVICTPTGRIVSMAKACLEGLAPGSVVTDVGSAKEEVVWQMDDLFDGRRVAFVGSHPKSARAAGVGSRRCRFIPRALVVVTQSALTNIDALSLTEAFWAGLRQSAADDAR